MEIETVGELVEHIADKVGVYGNHGNDCTVGNECRMCFTADLRHRIVEAVGNDEKLKRAGLYRGE